MFDLMKAKIPQEMVSVALAFCLFLAYSKANEFTCICDNGIATFSLEDGAPDSWVLLSPDSYSTKQAKCSPMARHTTSIKIAPLDPQKPLYCSLWTGPVCIPDASHQLSVVPCAPKVPAPNKTTPSVGVIGALSGFLLLVFVCKVVRRCLMFVKGVIIIRKYWFRQKADLHVPSEVSSTDEELEAFDSAPASQITHVNMGMPVMGTYPMQPMYTYQPSPMIQTNGMELPGSVQLFPVHPMMQTNTQVDPLATLAPVYTNTNVRTGY